MNTVPVRREGFAGQHLIVVPAPVRQSAGSHPLMRGLFVTDAGYFPKAAGHRVERPQGAATHLLIACLHGCGWARGETRTVALAAGDVVWLPADAPHAYGADENAPWTIVWAHFRGDEVDAWRNLLGWAARGPLGLTQFGADQIIALGLDRVYAQLETGYSLPHLLGAGAALRATFCNMLEAAAASGSVRTAAERTAAVREEICATPARSRRLEELATAAGLSIPHFCTLFRQQTGYAPIDFLIRQRIRLACRQLDTTNETIAVIGANVGFVDPYYFSRCFHRIMGCSPRGYRKTIKG